MGISASVFLSMHFLYRTVAPIEGHLSLAGLQSEVKIYRDKWGVPHIEADNNLDAFRALGFTQASDRLFQMELLRRIGSARLSEILGPELLKTDILLRTLRLKKTAREIIKNNWGQWPEELKQETTAFLDGINQFIKTMPLPIEFILLGIEPEPFTLEDSIAVSGYMALSFAEGLLIDPLHTDLSDELPKEKLKELFIETKNDKNSIMPRVSNSYFKNIRESLEILEENFGLFHGSNSWVLAGSKTKSGSPMLCNDPHVAFSLPGIWHEAHIKTPTKELYGYYVPLSPYTPMGNNKEKGWAVTMAEVDDLDIYDEKIKDNKVMYKNKWVDLKVEREVIKVKDSNDYIFELKSTPHGPLLDNTSYGLKGRNLALAWSFHHPKNDTVLALYKLSKANSVEEFQEAVSYGGAPGLNLSWVDSKGNIAWKIMAKIPIRPKGTNSKMLLEGWSGKHDYLGYLPSSENPGLINPKRGYIATANYVPEYKGNHPMPGYYQASERFERIESIIQSKDKWSLKEMMNMQTDQVVGTASWMVPILVENIEANTDLETKALNQLKNWKGDSHTESLGSSVYHMLSIQIIKDLLIKDFGEERYKTFSRTADIWHFYKTVLNNPTSPWWNGEMKKMITKSFKKSLNHLIANSGNDPSLWKWGTLHTLEYPHPFGKKEPLNKIFNRGPYPAGGGFFQIDNMSNARSDFNFNVTLGPSVRRLIDFADPLNSYNVQPSGNSGNIMSDFYDDQIQMFLDREYREASLNWNWIKKNSKLLRLKP